MQINNAIFKAYDIRGIYPSEINEISAYAIGRAYATLIRRELKKKDIIISVASDARLSSPSLKAELVRGIIDTGVNVLDLGLLSTPSFYYATAANKYDGGIQVSASHNPKDWNGFKIVRERGLVMSLMTGLGDLRDMISQDNFDPMIIADGKGKVTTVPSIVEAQVYHQARDLVAEKPIRPMKIVVDTANGMGISELRELAKLLPEVTFIWMNEAHDGSFPAHPANPMEHENNVELCRMIMAEKADLGIATDGDGDRVFFFDENGEMIPQEILRAIIAEVMLAVYPGAKIVYDVRPGRITLDTIREHGGQPVLAPVGHSLIKALMLEHDSVYGGESSGHHFFKFTYGTFEAPAMLIVYFLQFISHSPTPVSEQVRPYKRYFNSGEINTKLQNREDGLASIERLKQKYVSGEQNLLDGLSVTYPDYSFNVRLSNTEPLIRLIVESDEKDKMEKKKEEILDFIRNGAPGKPPSPVPVSAITHSSPFIRHWPEYLVYTVIAVVALFLALNF